MTLADDYLAADSVRYRALEAIEDRLNEIFDVPDEQDWWDHLAFDPCDWDGQSVEFMAAEPQLEPTEAQLEQIWEMGFNVVRIWYKQIEGSTWENGRMSGDWWCVQGQPLRHCVHTVVR